jgi:2'-5' RNA ligase
MRVFLAIDLPDEIRHRLGEAERMLRPAGSSARWVLPESIHVTLKFIGEIDEKRLPEIDSALQGLNWKPFPLTVRGVGFFPGNRAPRVFWAGIEAPTMQSLAEQIDLRMERIGIERERRAFRPHLTLARARDARIDSALVTASQQFEETEFGTFTVDRYVLFHSLLQPTGAIYRKLKEYWLAPKSSPSDKA